MQLQHFSVLFSLLAGVLAAPLLDTRATTQNFNKRGSDIIAAGTAVFHSVPRDEAYAKTYYQDKREEDEDAGMAYVSSSKREEDEDAGMAYVSSSKREEDEDAGMAYVSSSKREEDEDAGMAYVSSSKREEDEDAGMAYVSSSKRGGNQ